MRYIKTYENYSNKSLAKTVNLNLEPFLSINGKWKTIDIDGLYVNIQPHSYLFKGYDEKIVNDIISKIKPLSNRWKLIGGINLYQRNVYVHDPKLGDTSNIGSYQHLLKQYLNFRITDIEGDSEYGTDSEIPEDIKSEIIGDINSKLKGYDIDIEEFDDRGYLIVNIEIQSEINENYHNIEIPTYDDMRDLTYNKSLKFTKNEYERLKDEFIATGLYFSLDNNDMSIDFSYNSRKNGFIKKLDDEWYVIVYQSYDKYYKCDTIDGLIEEIKRYIS